MKKSLGTRIDWTNLEPGQVYRCKVAALGEVLARLVNKKTLEFEIVEGRLQSQADRKKIWTKGQTFTALPGYLECWEVQ